MMRNPLFGLTGSRRRHSSLKLSQAGETSLAGLHYWMKEPLDTFQRGVSNGTASLESAKLCLELQLRNSIFACASTPGRAIDTAGAGNAVLNWLWSSGMQESGVHLKDTELIKLLTVFLVVEQRYDVIYDWSLQLQDRNLNIADKAYSKSQSLQANLLRELIRSETRYGAGLSAAMVHFTQYFQRKHTSTFAATHKNFEPAGNFLAQRLADPGKAEAIPRDILSSFTATTRGWAESTSLANAILNVYQLESPNPHIALHYLQQFPVERLAHMPASRRSQLIMMSLKAVELLLSSNQRSSANWILQFVQSHCADDVGPMNGPKHRRNSDTKTMVEDEALSLQALETLAIP